MKTLCKPLITAACVAALLVACVLPTDESPDGANDVGATAGKADGSAFSSCEINAVLALVNDPTTTAELLRAAGVHSRAAGNIIDYRDGEDANHAFDDATELDDVSYVGPVAFRQLVAAVANRCQGADETAQAIFSPQAYEVSHLSTVADEIDQADLSLDIAMYSFRDAGVQAAIERAIARGVVVRMVFETANGDHNDPAGTSSARLEEAGVDVRYINKIMHHKYVIIDGPQTSAEQAADAVLITGSANWSNSAATRYDENTVLLRGNAEAVLEFQREFNLMWEHSRDLVWNNDLEYFTTLPINDAMIVDDPAIEAVFTSANFTVSESSRYGWTFSVVRGSNEVSDRLVDLIWSAESSIRVASGHLRSRPVAEALMARREADPELDIRVYLDAQEYLGYSTHNSQVRELEQCLEEAGDSEAARGDCLDSGFLFSYALHQTGIGVRYKYYSYRWHYSYAVQMHHKYMIIDDRIVASGSYNLSDNAEHNTLENILIFDASRFPGLVRAFEDNFETLWETAREDGLYDQLMDDITDGSGPIPLVFESMSLTWPEVNALKSAIRDACPDVNSYEFRRNPEAHRTCYR